MSEKWLPRCDSCNKVIQPEDKVSCDGSVDLICIDCAQNAAESAYERRQAADLECPPESSREEQLRTWEEHKKAHQR